MTATKAGAAAVGRGPGTDFTRATRRTLFGNEPHEARFPGDGKSAAATPERHVRVKVTMNIDGDIVAHFKAWAKHDGRRYQTLMNQVLREYIEGSRPERLAREIGELLAADPDFIATIASLIKEASSGDR